MDFEYLHQVLNETLRLTPATSVSTMCQMTQDVTFFDGFRLSSETMFVLNITGCHMDPEQWIEPERFVPDRFNPKSKWFKKPNGGTRNPLTFTPFLGGKRNCIGKTFTETVVRYTIPILYYHFDIEFLDQKNHENMPYFNSSGIAYPKIPVRLTSKFFAK